MSDFKVAQRHSAQPGNHSYVLQPSAVFPILAEAIQDEIAFFSHDLGGNIYPSESISELVQAWVKVRRINAANANTGN